MKELDKQILQKRRDFANVPLDEQGLPEDPHVLFETWMRQADEAEVLDPYAMTLSTVSQENKPSSRVLYLRGIAQGGYAFYTNYLSQKGEELAENSAASMLFLWLEMDRQIRLEGRVEKLDPALSDAYFASRPKSSQIGAWASAQSQQLKNRAELEDRVKALTQEYEGKSVPRPPHWGGYALIPERMEFWQGRPSRLHDRIVYAKDGERWTFHRVSP